MVASDIPVQTQHISLITIIILFLSYILIHIFLYFVQKNSIKELEKQPNNEELLKQAKIVKLLFKWWPAIFVVLFVLYNVF